MQEFSVGAFGWRPVVFLLGVVVAFPALLTWIALWAVQGRHPSIAVLVLALTLPLTFALLAQLGVTRLRVEAGRLIAGGGLYRESLPLVSVQLDAIRPLSAAELSRRLGTRTNGVGMPGFALGWFRAGKAKKVFATVGSGEALYLPTSGPYDLVVSPLDGAAFLAAMRGR